MIGIDIQLAIALYAIFCLGFFNGYDIAIDMMRMKHWFTTLFYLY
jgi:hypothetical protein